MATAMKKLGVYLGFVDDEPGYDGYDGYDTGNGRPIESTESYAPVASLDRGPATQADRAETVDLRASSRKAAPSHAPKPKVSADPYSIHTIHPRSYNEARRIGEEFRAGAPVIVNLTEMDDNDAKRIVDFAAGLVFGVHGSIERITKKVFLLSPANVDLRDAPAVQQARDGFFNQS